MDFSITLPYMNLEKDLKNKQTQNWKNNSLTTNC